MAPRRGQMDARVSFMRNDMMRNDMVCLTHRMRRLDNLVRRVGVPLGGGIAGYGKGGQRDGQNGSK